MKKFISIIICITMIFTFSFTSISFADTDFDRSGVLIYTTEENLYYDVGDIRNLNIKIVLQENYPGALKAGRYVDFDFLDYDIEINGPIKAKLNSGKQVIIDDKFMEMENVPGNWAWNNVLSFSFKVPESGEIANNSGSWKTQEANTIEFEVPISISTDFSEDVWVNITGAKAGIDEIYIMVASARYFEDLYQPISDDDNNNSDSSGDLTSTSENDPTESDESDNSNSSSDNTDDLNNNFNEGSDNTDNYNDNASDGSDNTDNLNNNPNESSDNTDKNNDNVAGEPSNTDDLNDNFDNDTNNMDNWSDNSDDLNSDDNTERNISSMFIIGQPFYSINGEIRHMDVFPVIRNNRTMLPFRYVAGACGLDENLAVSWNAGTKTAAISGYGKVMMITKDNKVMVVIENGIPRYVVMDTAAIIEKNRVYAPLRAVAEELGLSIEWYSDSHTVIIYNNDTNINN